jgi:probable rRNA maturation factor
MRVQSDILVEDPRWTATLDLQLLVDRVIDAALSAIDAANGEPAEISLLFADDARISLLKGAWLGKNAPTNVLSFPAAEGGRSSAADQRFLGDMILSFDTIRRESEAEGKPFEAHLAHMIAHGFLHLMGYDHIDDEEANVMEAMESRVLLTLGMPDPWLTYVDRGDEA